VLLNPGPSVVSDRVHRAIAGPDLCHREAEFEALAREVRSDLLRVAGVETGWEAVLLTGSGTSAMEAMVGAAARPGRRLLVVRNGTYGDRLATMAERAGLPHVDVLSGHATPVDPLAVRQALDAHPDVDAILVVHHETTTGMLNPLAELAAIARERGVLLAVDAVSSFGAEVLPLEHGGIDLVAGTANKCLHGLPGVAFVLLSPAAVARAREARPPSLYLDLATYLAAAERGGVPFTPAVPATYALRAALEELLDEGVESRRATYQARMRLLDDGLRRLGLEPPVAAEHRSASVRAVPLPAGVSYTVLHDRLKAAGYVIYAGQGEAAADQFRVCALGTVGVDALRGLLAELGTIMAEAGAGTPDAAA
jgi:2-aminoethylphosphonate-pyruvate transaminase